MMTMLVTGGVLAAFSACAMPFATHWAPSDRLKVQLHVHFDRSMSKRVRRIFEEEATAIWNAYGVQLAWSDEPEDGALQFDVIVGRHVTRFADRSLNPPLGVTTIDPSGLVRGPIRLWVDTIESLLDGRDSELPSLHDTELGRALGRVLAHELGHALLGTPSYHDPTGLMRPAFPADDLARIDRWPFELTDRSAARLRAHMVRLSVAQRILALHPAP